MRLLLSLFLSSLAATHAAAQTPADAVRAQAEGRLVRGLTEHALGNDSVAVRLYEEAAALAPGSAGPLDALAEAYTALGRPTDALYHAGLAVAAAPENAGVRRRLGSLQVAAGQRDAGLATLEQARRLSPTDAATLSALAALYRDTGRTADERAALEALPPTATTLLRLAETAPDAESRQAALSAATRLAPGDPRVRARIVQNAMPAAPVGDSAPAGSADAALAIVAADPRRLDAWAEALTALASARDPRAGTTADDATLLFPTVPSVLAPAAEAYLAAGRPTDAARTARAGLAALDAAPDAALRARLDLVLSQIPR